MTNDDAKKLAEEAKELHEQFDNGVVAYCGECTAQNWPCETVALADALLEKVADIERVRAEVERMSADAVFTTKDGMISMQIVPGNARTIQCSVELMQSIVAELNECRRKAKGE